MTQDFLSSVNSRIRDLCRAEVLLGEWMSTDDGKEIISQLAKFGEKEPEFRAYVASEGGECFKVRYYVSSQSFRAYGSKIDEIGKAEAPTSYDFDKSVVYGALSFWRTLYLRARAVASVTITEIEFSEFYFPSVVACFPVVVLLFNLISC